MEEKIEEIKGEIALELSEVKTSSVLRQGLPEREVFYPPENVSFV